MVYKQASIPVWHVSAGFIETTLQKCNYPEILWTSKTERSFMYILEVYL